MPSGLCPDCGGNIMLNPTKVGQMLTCPHCDVELEVVSDEPLKFDWAYDWTWEDQDEEEEEEEEEEE